MVELIVIVALALLLARPIALALIFAACVWILRAAARLRSLALRLRYTQRLADLLRFWTPL
jgi:hypothetical protein